MGANQCQLLIADERAAGPARSQTYRGDDRLEVRDLATRATVTIRAAEVSPYRHTLFLGGRAYRILNVFKG